MTSYVICKTCGAENTDPHESLKKYNCGQCGEAELIRINKKEDPNDKAFISSGVGAAVGAGFGGPIGAVLGAVAGYFWGKHKSVVDVEKAKK